MAHLVVTCRMASIVLRENPQARQVLRPITAPQVSWITIIMFENILTHWDFSKKRRVLIAWVGHHDNCIFLRMGGYIRDILRRPFRLTHLPMSQWMHGWADVMSF